MKKIKPQITRIDTDYYRIKEIRTTLISHESTRIKYEHGNPEPD